MKHCHASTDKQTNHHSKLTEVIKYQFLKQGLWRPDFVTRRYNIPRSSCLVNLPFFITQ